MLQGVACHFAGAPRYRHSWHHVIAIANALRLGLGRIILEGLNAAWYKNWHVLSWPCGGTGQSKPILIFFFALRFGNLATAYARANLFSIDKVWFGLDSKLRR